MELILASTSTLYNEQYLAYLMPTLKVFFKNCKEVIFIPFARPAGISHDDYTKIVFKTFKEIDVNIKGLHEFDNQKLALKEAQAIFTGGGNTFVLVDELYKRDLMKALKSSVVQGTPYLGTSAGSNLAGVTMQTTNDMPIVDPVSLKTLGLIPFNLNVHYMEPDPNSKHKGETRQTRINEFHSQNSIPVIGLREGSWLRITDDQITLMGPLNAILFSKGEVPIEVNPSQHL